MSDAKMPIAEATNNAANENWIRDNSNVSVLQAIRAPEVFLSLWRRPLPLCLSRWLDAVPADALPDFRVQMRAPFHAHAFDPHLSIMPEHRMRDALAENLSRLATLFCDIIHADILRIRLERVPGDGCILFHRDSVPHRLITTYRGAGTEWVYPDAAPQARALQNDFKGRINRLNAGDVVMMKGSLVDPELGVMHRSPRQSGSSARIVLCMDPVAETAPSAE